MIYLFISLGMIYLFFGNDCYKLFYCNFFFREKMRFYHDSVDVTSSKYKTFDFHYFLKAVHEEIDCINQPVCKIFNFRLSLERLHFHEKKIIQGEEGIFCCSLYKTRKSTSFSFNV